MSLDPGDLIHGAARGVVGAMAMTGVREVTKDLGLLSEPPPEAIARRPLRRLLRQAPRRRRRAAVELLHWAFGGVFGAVFAALPDPVRQRLWAGPLYGVAVWAGYGAVAAPILDLPHAERHRLPEHAAIVADHLVYGLVLSEFRRRPER